MMNEPPIIRSPIQQLAALGPLPDDDVDASPALLDAYADLLAAITTPPNVDELAVLLTLFGNDLCYGLAWTLLHRIEMGSIAELEAALSELPAGYWLDMLRGRLANWHQNNG